MYASLRGRAQTIERRHGQLLLSSRSSAALACRIGRRRRAVGVARRIVGDESMTSTAHRQQRRKTLTGRENMELVVRHIGIGVEVGEHERLLERLARKVEAEQVPHGAVRTIGGDDERRMRRFLAAVGMTQVAFDARAALREPHELDTPLDDAVEGREMPREDAPRDRLVQTQEIGIARLQRIEVEPREPMAVRIEIDRSQTMARLEETLDLAD